MSFAVAVVTPEASALDTTATQVILPAHDGQMGILTGRAPMLVQLGAGVMHVDMAGGRQSFFVRGGVAQMKDNKLTVLTEQAIPPSQIDRAKAQAELADAEALEVSAAMPADERQRRINGAKAKIAAAA